MNSHLFENHFADAQQDKTQETKKIKALAVMADGIAHDFNNIIAGILGSAELVRMDISPDHPGNEFLQQIFEAGNRARELIRQMMALNHLEKNNRSLIFLEPLIQARLKLLRAAISPKIELTHHIESSCPPVLADSAQIHQAIANLCVRASHTLPERGGKIHVSIEACEPDEAAIAARNENADYVRISIRDNGSGVDGETLERIFDPFAIRKRGSGENGLELALARGIAHANGGFAVAESNPGKGTAFHIYLPAQFQE